MNLYNIFYKQYYLDDGFQLNDKVTINSTGKSHISNKNRVLLDATINCDISEMQSSSIANPEQSFTLEVAYPGLITGVGISHNIKGVDDEFKLGIHFDYTTGMPVIYGSTVKGVLKSYIKHYDVEGVDSLDLEKEIFEGLQRTDNGYEPMSIYDRDIFFDAVIVQGAGNSNKFLATDTICPHTDGPLKNPTPINFLKIAPGVKFEFRFKLKDSRLISARQKKTLFEEILRDWGVGAKTNVGYGHFM